MSRFDREHLWHPYTSLKKPLCTYTVSAAEGVYLELDDGRRLVDGMASWWSVIHGYNNKALNEAATTQLGKFSHVMFGGLTHEPAIELGRVLLSIAPSSLSKIFYCDSGSVSVEVAMKMAVQYWRAQGIDKTRFITVRRGYHGDTLSAMSVSDPETGMHDEFSHYIPKQLFVPEPPLGFDTPFHPDMLSEFKQRLASHEDIAALIIEPVVQGAGGMRIYSPDYLSALVQCARAHGLLVIFDEIATGFARTGNMFASDFIEQQPDILCVGKAITGGYLSFAATLCNDKVANGINAHGDGTFMHGPTFMGNPLACQVAKTSIELLVNSPWKKTIAHIEKYLYQQLMPLKQHVGVADVRILGAIAAVEMVNPVDVAKAQASFVKNGAWIRPFGRLIYVMPPYVINEEQILVLCRAIKVWIEQDVGA